MVEEAKSRGREAFESGKPIQPFGDSQAAQDDKEEAREVAAAQALEKVAREIYAEFFVAHKPREAEITKLAEIVGRAMAQAEREQIAKMQETIDFIDSELGASMRETAAAELRERELREAIFGLEQLVKHNREAAKLRERQMREALCKFGRHAAGCQLWKKLKSPCDCGWAEIFDKFITDTPLAPTV